MSTTHNRANMHVYQLMVSMRLNCNTGLKQYIVAYAYTPNVAHLHQSCPTPDILFAFRGPFIVIYLRNKDQQDALFFLNLYRVSNTVTIHHQQAVTVYATYGIYCVCVTPKIRLHCSAPYNKHTHVLLILSHTLYKISRTKNVS